MKSTRRLWQSLEATPFIRGVRRSWVDYVGEDLPLLEPHLKPEERLAETYPCPRPGGDGCPRGVTVHTPDHVVAYCRDRPRSCDDLRLTQEDIVVWRLDLAGIAADVARLLGLQGNAPVGIEGLHQTYQMGAYCPVAGIEIPVYLTVRPDREEFTEVVERLAAREKQAFLLLAPTTDLVVATTSERLRTQGSLVLGLADIVAADEAGRLVLARPVEEILAGFQDEVMRLVQGQRKPGMATFLVPAGTLWRDVHIRLIFEDKVSVEAKGRFGVFTYSALGMEDGRTGNPDGQWALLKILAKSGGRLDWTKSDANTLLKKHRQLLVARLRSFFGIPGDPIPYRRGRRRTKEQPGDIAHWEVAFHLYDERGKQHSAGD